MLFGFWCVCCVVAILLAYVVLWVLFEIVATPMSAGLDMIARPGAWGWAARALFILAVLLGLLHRCVLSAPPPVNRGPLNVTPTPQMVELGRKLFFDPRLSENNTVSCATCHNPRKGWADGLELAVGIRGSVGTRHSPSIINSSYTPLVFWDGRTTGFVTQALLPLSNRLEMGNQTEQQVITKLRTIPGYQKLFLEAFPSPRQLDPQTLSPVTGVNLAMAIAAFESTVTSFNAPIDRRLDGDLSALSADAEVGFGIFQQSNCMSCHTPPLFTDNSFHNNGMEFAGRLLARGQQYDRGRAGPPINSRRPSDERAFKTPTLREIARTAPYNHAGNFATLERVVIHYNAGGRRYDDYVDRFMDPRIRPLGLSESQMRYLVIFLKEAFAGSNYPMITEPQLP